jgi:hypothetical protein
MWSKFARIYFNDGSKPSYQMKAIKEPLLKFPKDAEACEAACKCYRVLLKLAYDESTPEQFYHAMNFVVEQERTMENRCQQLPGGFYCSDEILCQICKLMNQNPEKYVGLFRIECIICRNCDTYYSGKWSIVLGYYFIPSSAFLRHQKTLQNC